MGIHNLSTLEVLECHVYLHIPSSLEIIGRVWPLPLNGALAGEKSLTGHDTLPG